MRRALVLLALALLAPARARADVAPVDQYSHANDRFGTALALDGARLAIGAPGSNSNGLDAGLVHVYELDDGAWQLVARIENPDPDPAHGGFAGHLALSGGSLAVTARRDAEARGVVHVFALRRGEWQHQATLADPGTDHDHYGHDLALHGDTLAVASDRRVRDRAEQPPHALVYRRIGDEWREEVDLELPSLGYSSAVGLGDGTLLIESQDNGLLAYRRDGDVWRPDPSLVLDPSGLADFALVGDTAVVVDGKTVTVLRDRDGAWSIEATFDHAGAAAEVYTDGLGLGRDALATSFEFFADDGEDHRRVAVWRRVGDVWRHAGDIDAPPDLPVHWNGFGAALALDDRWVAVADPFGGTPMYEQSGRVHLFAGVDGFAEVDRLGPDDALAGCGCRTAPRGAPLLGLLALLLLRRRPRR